MLKIGIIGTGFIGQAHAKAVSNSTIVKLTAVSDMNEKAAKETAETYGCDYYVEPEKMLQREDIDVVIICLPTFLHEKYTVLSANSKKHILCEKPAALCLNSFDRMTEAAKLNNVRLMIAQAVRFQPETRLLVEYIRQGVLENVYSVSMKRIQPTPEWGQWFGDPEKSGGGLFDLHIHDIDNMVNLFGMPESVFAVGNKSVSGCFNTVTSCLMYKSGMKAVIECCSEMPKDYPFNKYMRLFGSGGTIEAYSEVMLKNKILVEKSITHYSNEYGAKILDIEQLDAYQNEIEYFCTCITTDKPNTMVPLKQSRNVLELILKARESLEQCAIIKV